MRGRFSSGILKRIGLSDLAATTDDGYVDTGVRLARDRDYRQRCREQIAISRDSLFDDIAPIRALERFLGDRAPAPAC